MKGSDRLCSTKVIIESTVASANAIQQPNPMGISAAVVARNWVFVAKGDLLKATPALVSKYHVKGKIPRHTTHTVRA